MKTLNFGRITIEHEDTGEVKLSVFVPGEGKVSLGMSPDELMLFMVEVSNGLAVSRDIQMQRRIERDIENENRKHKVNGWGSDAHEGE